MNSLSALVVILAYGLALGVAGLILALRERAVREERAINLLKSSLP